MRNYGTIGPARFVSGRYLQVLSGERRAENREGGVSPPRAQRCKEDGRCNKPLTAVGKIFKPELKLRETEDALIEALRSAGVPFVSVKADNHPSLGTLVDVALAEGADRKLARSALGQFAVRFRLGDAPR